MAKGNWTVCGQLNRVGEAIGEVDQPGGEKKQPAQREVKMRLESMGKEPLPADRDNRRIEAKEV